MNKLNLIYLLFFPFVVFGQQKEKYHVEYYSDQKIKQEWYTLNNDTIKYWKGYLHKKDSIISYEKYYTNQGSLISEGWTLNHSKHGFWEFYNDDKTTSQGDFVNNKKNGFWNNQKDLKNTAEGYYKAGKKNGLWKYFSNGVKDSIGNYKSDQKTGTWEYYHKGILYQSQLIIDASKSYLKNYNTSGKISEEGRTFNNQKSRYWKIYHINGDLKEEGDYKNGLKTGYWKTYHTNNILIAKGSYKNGLKNGYWHFFSETGLPLEEGKFSENKKSMWWQFFNKKGVISHKCELKNDTYEGYCIHYLNGNIKKASLYKEGKKLKEWTDIQSFKKDNGK